MAIEYLKTVTEAAAFGDNENGSLDEKAQKALECPCIADLRNGPCGSQFSEAFLCFLKSTAEEKGSDCVRPFVNLQSCIKANPNAFAKDILEDDEVEKEEEPTRDYKIHPPICGYSGWDHSSELLLLLCTTKLSPEPFLSSPGPKFNPPPPESPLVSSLFFSLLPLLCSLLLSSCGLGVEVLTMCKLYVSKPVAACE
ncbi:mitochondrial intermembrane space import and assembly protein 40 homolog isoform X5 [Actinidia eriantha]|uniref:mitochondrial intermembrane space import and assembly protein 40 homolog isoform X5 n=1 Tax=Actinidia eriantha TaxID=165200 RepID=UPI00258EBE4F|nr:mitochondrial intermembrane space import and assembly protein 40 homolog isoform X5 [Actinidia eriantha]